MKRIQRAFVTGLLVLVPVLATIDIMIWLVTFVDSNARHYIPPGVLVYDFPGSGMLFALGLVFLVGMLTQNFIGTWFVNQFDNLLTRFPVVGGLYGAIKKFMETVLNPSNDKFNKAVMVEFPKEGVFSIGFITGDPDAKLTENLGRSKLINVFIPLVPNPTAGFYFLIPEKDVVVLDMTVQEAFKVAISMGVVTSREEIEPHRPRRKRKKKK